MKKKAKPAGPTPANRDESPPRPATGARETGPKPTRPFAVYVELVADDWRTWDGLGGSTPVPRKLSQEADGRVGWVIRRTFEESLRATGSSAARGVWTRFHLATAGGRFLGFTGRVVGDVLTLGPDYAAVLAAYLNGTQDAKPGRAVVYHPGDGSWVRVEFAESADFPHVQAPVGRRPGVYEPFPSGALAALQALVQRTSVLSKFEMAERLAFVFSSLTGKAAARADQARSVVERLNTILDDVGLVLHYGGRPVRLSVVNLKTTAGTFRLRALGTKNPESVSASRTFPEVTVVPLRLPDEG